MSAALRGDLALAIVLDGKNQQILRVLTSPHATLPQPILFD